MALQLAVATMQGCQLLGLPECDVLLAQCAIYLARAPKSREADSALAKAKSVVNNHKGAQPSVPMQLRNAPTKLMKELGMIMQTCRLDHGTSGQGMFLDRRIYVQLAQVPDQLFHLATIFVHIMN